MITNNSPEINIVDLPLPPSSIAPRKSSNVSKFAVANRLLLRSDLHKLFDQGYLTVEPKERRLLVNRRKREEFENWREYYNLDGKVLREPSEAWARPLTENLEYHPRARLKS